MSTIKYGELSCLGEWEDNFNICVTGVYIGDANNYSYAAVFQLLFGGIVTENNLGGQQHQVLVAWGWALVELQANFVYL